MRKGGSQTHDQVAGSRPGQKPQFSSKESEGQKTAGF
jgi:hypothetical protein